MEQNKTGKYFKYAIGEVVLVVIGILIALSINNWNENRKKQIREVLYLERLSENLSTDLIQLELNLEFYTKVFEYGSVALDYVENDTIDSSTSWDVLVSFFHSSQIWPIISNSATFEELKSSGELSLIQSISLRNELSYYHGNGFYRYNQTVGINPPYRKMVRGLIPSKVQSYFWENCHSTLGDAQILKKCASNISEKESIEIIKKLKNNSKLIEELRFYMSSITVGLPTISEQQKLCKKMLEEITFSLQQ